MMSQSGYFFSVEMMSQSGMGVGSAFADLNPKIMEVPLARDSLTPMGCVCGM